jgi:hypothetical protein
MPMPTDPTTDLDRWKATQSSLQRPEMRLPGWSSDMDKGKDNLASHYQAYEMRILNECAGLAKSGFADERLAAAAYQKFEEAFLLLRKALRRAEDQLDPNDYGKRPSPGPLPDEFAPRVDDNPPPDAGTGVDPTDGGRRIEWQNFDSDHD